MYSFCSTKLHHGQENWPFYHNHRSKLSTPTLRKPILSSSASHTSSASNSTRTSISSQLDNKYITTNQNKNNISNTDDIHSCVTPLKQNHSVQATYTNTHLTPFNTALPIAPVELHTTKQLTPSGKEYLFLYMKRKSSHAAQCVKSRIINKAIDFILSTDTFEQQCVMIKDMLQSPRLEYYMENIGIDQSLSNRSSFEQKCLNNIKKIYQHAVKCDDQQNLKDILDSAMVSTPEEITDVSPSLRKTSTTIKNQVLGNHCVYSPTHLMLKRKLHNVVLELQNQNREPLKLVIACGPIKKN